MMFSHECSVNQSDNSNEKSQRNVNSSKLSLALENTVRSSKRKRQSSLRKCKSESNVREMGSRLSRSKSLENVDVEFVVAYESLKRKRNTSLASEESADDYKLLESSELDSETDCESSVIEQTSKTDNNVHDSAENSSNDVIVDNCVQHRAGNEIKSDLQEKKFLTLPRVKFKSANRDHEMFERRSAPYKSLDNRAYCSKQNVGDKKRLVVEDKASDEAFRSTTLPKTRPRCEPFFRHSLRRAIDLTTPRTHSRISNASEDNLAIIPGTNEPQTDSLGKVRRTRSNLSWLRKSMRKLNPFQMPQVQVEQNIPVASTSDLNPCGSKQIESPSHDLQSRSNDEDVESFQTCSSNPDLFNIVLTEQLTVSELNRPRQYGRRSNPVRISSFEIESSNNGSARIIAHHQQERRPASAPVQRLHNTTHSSVHRSRANLPSEPSSLASSRNSSPMFILARDVLSSITINKQ